MLDIPTFKHYDNEKRIAILDNSSIAFLEKMERCGFLTAELLSGYDLILIPNWVAEEIKDSPYRSKYIKKSFEAGMPFCTIPEEKYAELVYYEEGRLYSMVYAAASRLGPLKSYLRRYVQKQDPLDMEAYCDWIRKMYQNWPLKDECIRSGRVKKKNAGEISITILAEIFSCYYPNIELITIYTQDRDTYDYQESAHKQLKQLFIKNIPVHVGYKSNDSLLQQLYLKNRMTLGELNELRTDARVVTFTKRRADHSTILVSQKVNNEQFIKLLQDDTTQIIF